LVPHMHGGNVRRFDQVVREVEAYAARFHEKLNQSLAIVVFNPGREVCEARYTHPDAERQFIDELRQRAKECLRNGRDTASDEDAESIKSQAVLLRSNSNRIIHGVVVVAGYGSKNAELAQYAKDIFFGRKLRPAPGGHRGKA
jgi:hypothetical protein